MVLIGCDFHPSWQQVSWVDTETGETEEKKLVHGSGEVERFYRELGGWHILARAGVSGAPSFGF